MTDILTRPATPADARLFYGSLPDQFGDLRLPPGDGPFPVAVTIHGGFWRARYDLSHAGHMAADLTRQGIATWTVEYRRVGTGGGFPQTVEDVEAALGALAGLPQREAFDLERVVVVGHSAGGHLALLAGRARESGGLPRVRGVVALAAVSDVREAARRGLGAGIVEEFMGGRPEEVPQRYAAGSPVERLPLGVPQVLIHGEADAIIPAEMSETYVRRAREVGDAAAVRILPGTGHFEVIDPHAIQFGAVRQSVRELLASC